ncbi:MAG TPA: ROK family protein [Burkholderiales bacterium]|nr:ROK family protein [Burkholderiales bacterium]
MIRIGVDIGGTKMEIAALDESGAEVFRRRGDAPRGAYPDALRALADAVLAAEAAVGARCTVGVGTPGAVSGDGRLRRAYASALNGMPLKPDLERLLGREVRFANDANCFALSEAADGAAAGAGVVFGVILGTGVGGGTVVGGRVLHGANAIAGEWGHNSLPWIRSDELPGPRCGCGREGHIEAFLSGPGLARDLELTTGPALEPAQIIARAAAGDPGCEAALARYEERLGRALASVINLLDPDVIVLGGGLSNAERLYRSVPAHWARYVYSDSVATPLVKAKHGDASGVRGAARLW